MKSFLENWLEVFSVTMIAQNGIARVFESKLSFHLDANDVFKEGFLFQFMPTQETNKVSPISQSNLVEVSVFAPAGQEKAGDEVRQFCEQLKPLVMFDADHRKIQQLPAT